MRALLLSRGCHSGRSLRQVGAHASTRKISLNHDPVHTPPRTPNRHLNCPLRVLVSFHQHSICPLPHLTKPLRKTPHPIHPPPAHPALRTSIFPAPIAERQAPFHTDDRQSSCIPPLNPQNPHPCHVASTVPLRLYPITALRRAPLRHRQISFPYPFLLLPSLVRAPSLKRCLPSGVPPSATMTGSTASTLGLISMVNHWILLIPPPWDGFRILDGYRVKPWRRTAPRVPRSIS